MLYYYIGKLLNDKITEQNWGDKVLSQIADDLKEQLPSLRGFSASNLKKMRQFYTAYEDTPIGSTLSIQLQTTDKQLNIIGSLATIQLQRSDSEEDWIKGTAEINNPLLSHFLSIILPSRNTIE